MKNKNVIELLSLLRSDVISNSKGKEFAYAVIKNIDILEKEAKIFEQLNQKQPHPDFINFENERQIVCIKHSKKDENGNPIIMNDQYQIENVPLFDIEMKEVQEKYKEVIQHQQDTQKEFIDFMEKDVTLELVKISINDVPNEITPNMLKVLKYMIND